MLLLARTIHCGHWLISFSVTPKIPEGIVSCIAKYITLLLPGLLYGAIVVCPYGGFLEDLIPDGPREAAYLHAVG